MDRQEVMDETTIHAPNLINGKDYIGAHNHSHVYTPLWYVVAVLVIVVFGIFGNLMTLVVLFKRKHWTSVNVLIGIMSLSDLLVLPIIASMPLQAHVFKNIPYELSYLEDALIASSCLCAMIIGCERSFAVSSPLKFKQKWNTKLTIKIYIVGYAVWLSFVLVRLLVSQIISAQYFDKYLYLPYFVVTRGIPFLVILITNVMMIRGLLRYRRRMSQLTSENFERLRIKKEASISRMVAIITTVYFICLIPSRVIAGVWHSGAFTDNNHITYFFATFFEILNFSVNIIIYTLTSQFFRTEYAKLLHMCYSESAIESVSESTLTVDMSII